MDEFILGFVNGSIQTIIGHPLDTIKVLLQQNKLKYPIKFSKLYQGVLPPLLGNSIIVSSQFGLNDYFYKYMNNHFYSGCLSGIISSFIVNPIELYKIRFQNSLTNLNINPYKGLYSTFLRESFGNSFYFGTYYYLHHNEICNSFLAGGISGWVAWFFSYPQDVIKTRIQSGYSKNIYEAYKYGKLWKGFGVCSIRSFIVNGVGFYCYDLMKIYYNIK